MSDEVTEYDIEDYQDLIDGGKSADQIFERFVRRGMTEARAQKVRAEFERRTGRIREMESVGVISDRTVKTGNWYSGVQVADVVWPRLRLRLESTLPAGAVDSIHHSSDRILAEIGAPAIPGRELRGLVLGFVQSGKTTNFMSVIAKAADRGYRFFIVLSGITENLRSQTQERVDEMLVNDNKQFLPLTSREADFEAPDHLGKIVSSSDMRLIAVVKKNPHRLRRLVQWLRSAQKDADAFPILIIDDEADQASIDVGQGRRSRINSLIRQILEHERAGYVAYTATPFANVLIDPEDSNDLYPKDFIVDLPKPDNYFGSAELFGRNLLETDESRPADGLDVIRRIPDEDVSSVRQPPGKGMVNGWDPGVPGSLLTAIRWFVLATAARRIRGVGNKHSTMLIHTSMLSRAHEKVAEVVREKIEFEWDRAATTEWRSELRHLWESESVLIDPSEYANVSVGFDELEGELEAVLDELKVVVDNYRSMDRLHYGAERQIAIVIGGNTLSRGLTLEGLVVSFFVRSSSTYDSLLQMGRWFGYRRGYEDLQRIWMTDELAEFFVDLATVEEEFRQYVKQYEFETTPAKVRPMIRTHPTLLVAARNKTRSSRPVYVSLSEGHLQTILFKHRDEAWLSQNKRATADLLTAAHSTVGPWVLSEMNSSARVFRDVPVEIIDSFLEAYQFHPSATRMRGDLIKKYIHKQNRKGALKTWNIVVMSNKNSERSEIELAPGMSVKPVERSRVKNQHSDHANIRTLIGPMDRLLDLRVSAEVKSELTASHLTSRKKLDYRADWVGDRGLLLVYPIARDSESKLEYTESSKTVWKTDLEAVEDVIGVAFQFPRAIGTDAEVEYISADTTQEEEFEVDSVDELDLVDEGGE
ncbi:Z1 domain-containing protein [Dietzia cercidiphylli]|uniref:Z1 domain-containing protein n=1 Tax=Dietzia cercidiphylli TaxID=498199 RepID=UPI00223BA86D|nr:Z1 domain-containing protein [Dietzia cercidiphylli]MCT1515628.1 Z1 domain-containing protein [Dietzia cercidiphylli]